MRPYEGAEEEGAKGFFKGVYKGTAGFICKPVSGVLDFTSKTAEGVKSSAIYFDEKPSEYRWRWPRAFYGYEKFFKIYSISDAEINYRLVKWFKGEFSNGSLIFAFDIIFTRNKNENTYIFGVYLEGLFLWDLKEKQLLWFADIENIEGIKEVEHGMEIILYHGLDKGDKVIN